MNDPTGNIPIDCYGTNYCGSTKSKLLPEPSKLLNRDADDQFEQDPLSIIREQYNDLVSRIESDGCEDLFNNPICLDYLSIVSQDIATIFSSGSAAHTTVDIVIGCALATEAGVIAGCAAGYKFGAMAHKMFFNYVESGMSTISFITTMRSDFVTGDTDLWRRKVGEDTKTGFVTFVLGSLIVEPYFDAAVDIYASGYNHGFFCGVSEILACLRP